MIDYDREKGRRLHDSILAAIENNAPVMMYGGEAFLYARDLIAELEAEIAKRERPDLKVLYAAIAERDNRIAELQAENNRLISFMQHWYDYGYDRAENEKALFGSRAIEQEVSSDE